MRPSLILLVARAALSVAAAAVTDGAAASALGCPVVRSAPLEPSRHMPRGSVRGPANCDFDDPATSIQTCRNAIGIDKEHLLYWANRRAESVHPATCAIAAHPVSQAMYVRVRLKLNEKLAAEYRLLAAFKSAAPSKPALDNPE